MDSPFLRPEFFSALAQSGCIGKTRGWEPVQVGTVFSFEKTHSYGEYIFDWSWAEAYQRYGVPYYPKLTSMIPFTPVTTRHSLGELALGAYEKFYQEGAFSSSHFLFLHPEEIEVFRSEHYFLRESLQYHWRNEGHDSFDAFLSSFKGKKAKQVRKERIFRDVSFHRFTGHALTEEHARRMYQFYLATIAGKNSYDYLNQDFFLRVFRALSENILMIEARVHEETVAASLFFFDESKLYGRYWGAKRYIENLHFELCYYQGIDFCLERNIPIFEAGAQGEHKISRGFRPTKVYSAHKLKHPEFSRAIGEFIEREKLAVDQGLRELELQLPFRP